MAEPRESPWYLRRGDQLLIAAINLLSLSVIAAWYIYQGGLNGRLIEVEQQPKRDLQYVVDVNQASWPELAQLPGIGETLAKRIVELRETSGPFRSPDDLLRVRGIGARKLDAIRPYLQPIPAEIGGQPSASDEDAS